MFIAGSWIEGSSRRARRAGPVNFKTIQNGEVQNFVDTLSIRFESPDRYKINAEDLLRLKRAFYSRSKDLKATHPFDYLEGRLTVEVVSVGSLERLSRTGKIKPVIDRRNL